MKHTAPDKYSIAWFKLAECVARGEKERALGVYRLLSHSIDNQAYVRQLEGDIFLACGDISGAIARYKDAANLYQEKGSLLQAANVYEHLLLLSADSFPFRLLVLQLYSTIPIGAKVEEHLEQAIDCLLAKGQLSQADELITKYESHVTNAVLERLYMVCAAQKPR